MLWEISEKGNQAKSIIQILQSILESRVSLLNHVTKSVPRLLLFQLLGPLKLLLTL